MKFTIATLSAILAVPAVLAIPTEGTDENLAARDPALINPSLDPALGLVHDTLQGGDQGSGSGNTGGGTGSGGNGGTGTGGNGGSGTGGAGGCGIIGGSGGDGYGGNGGAGTGGNGAKRSMQHWQAEKKIDRIEDRLGNIERLIRNLSFNSTNQSPGSSTDAGRVFTSHAGSVAGGEPSIADFDSSDAESVFGGDSALTEQTTFASEFLQSAVRNAPLPGGNPKMDAALANLSQLVDLQKRKSISHGPRFPLQTTLPPGGLGKLPMPPMTAVVSALKHIKGMYIPSIATDDVLTIGTAAPPSFFTSICALCGIANFSDLCRMVYFPTEDFTDSTFMIVNAGLYNLFVEQSALTPDTARRAEYNGYVHQCRVNLETSMANLPLFCAAKVENVQALLLSAYYAIDLSRPYVAWHLSSTAAQLCLTGGFHRKQSMINDPPRLAQIKTLVFWQIYSLDKGLSLRLARASVIRDCDIDIPRQCDLTGFEPLEGNCIPNFWIEMGTMQGRIYEDLYSPAALAGPKDELVKRAEALAAQCLLMSPEYDTSRKIVLEGLKSRNSSDVIEIFLRGDEILFQVSLTLIYRVIPAPEGSPTRFCTECLDAARSAMRIHHDALFLLRDDEYFTLLWFHWSLLFTPYAPFFILFCYIIETSSMSDLDILKQFVATLQGAGRFSETVEKLYRLCQVMYDVAALYVEAKQQQQGDQNMLNIGDHFQMYFNQLGFMTTEDTAMGPGASNLPRGNGQTAEIGNWLVALFPATGTCLSAVSWGGPRVDVFGLASDSSIWHKFYTGWDWQPASSFERLPAPDAGNPSATTWGEGRLDLVYVNASGSNVLHKFFGGGQWGPSFDDVEDLGGDVISLTSGSWGENRLDIVARSHGSFVHKAWTGTEWYPDGKKWEDFGGDFSSNPAIGSWGPGRLDVVGISSKNGSILHKFWHEGWSEWENLGGGPFFGNPRVTSWGPGRFDIWAIDQSGELNHLFWDGTKYHGWSKLGGKFEETPQVDHWNATHIDILGKTGDVYHIKGYDGSQWNPSADGWYDLAKSFSSEPSLVARKGTNFLSVFGVDQDESLRLQVWTGYDWQPASDKTWDLGDISKPRVSAVASAQSIFAAQIYMFLEYLKDIKSSRIIEKSEKIEEEPVVEGPVECARKHIESARLLLEKYPSTEVFANEIDAIESMLKDGSYHPHTAAELRAVYQAMAQEFSGTGHWYTCERRQPFTIGECGMAMEQARCRECGLPVVGSNHRAADGVRIAEEIEELGRDINGLQV
ncbi:N-terminal binuclear Zn cluster-containing protein [Paramyrothecium foliicola]|nr:N-terminal binuclear Zn cluster-containing protein [Paramyrothecium foliicola]